MTESLHLAMPLANCPWCGLPLGARITRTNPHAECRTEGCFGRKMASVNLDDPEDVAAYNRRALVDEAQAERIRKLEVALHNIATGTDIPGYTEEVADSDADCVYMFQNYARAALGEDDHD